MDQDYFNENPHLSLEQWNQLPGLLDFKYSKSALEYAFIISGKKLKKSEHIDLICADLMVKSFNIQFKTGFKINVKISRDTEAAIVVDGPAFIRKQKPVFIPENIPYFIVITPEMVAIK